MLVSLVERIHLRLLNTLVDRDYSILGPLDRPGGHSDSREYVRKNATEDLIREIRENCRKTIWLYALFILLTFILLIGVIITDDQANELYKYGGMLVSSGIFGLVIAMQISQTRALFDELSDDKEAPSPVKYMLTSSMTNIVLAIWLNTVNPGIAGLFLSLTFLVVIYSSTRMQLGNFITRRMHYKLDHAEMRAYITFAKENFSYQARAKIMSDQMEGDDFTLRQLIKLQDKNPENQGDTLEP